MLIHFNYKNIQIYKYLDLNQYIIHEKALYYNNNFKIQYIYNYINIIYILYNLLISIQIMLNMFIDIYV